MAVYESFSQELIIKRYKETRSFSHDEILRNDLTGKKIPNIHLDHVRIAETYLDKTDVTGMRCRHSSIEQSNCNELHAGESVIESSHIIGSNIIKADFTRSHVHNVRFDQCVAHNIRFSNARITSSVFNECQMYKAHFEGSILINVTFSPGEKGDLATLQKTQFTHSMICDSSFMNINCMNIELSGSVFIGCDFSGAELDNIDFSSAGFINCTFDGCRTHPEKLTNPLTGSTLFT